MHIIRVDTLNKYSRATFPSVSSYVCGIWIYYLIKINVMWQPFEKLLL